MISKVVKIFPGPSWWEGNASNTGDENYKSITPKWYGGVERGMGRTPASGLGQAEQLAELSQASGGFTHCTVALFCGGFILPLRV